MDALTFIATVVKAIVWPVVAGYTLWLFRANLPSALNDLFSRLTSAKAAGLELSFGKKLDEAEEVLPPPAQSTAEDLKVEIKSMHANVSGGELTAAGGEAESILSAYEIDVGLPPAYIVTQAWLRFEEEVQLYLQFRGIEIEGRHKAINIWLNMLKNDEMFSRDEFAQLSELRSLRNRVAHYSGVSLTRTDALRYNDIMNGLIERIRSKRLPPSP